MKVTIDTPAVGAAVDPLNIRIAGTIELGATEEAPLVIEAVVGGDAVGHTHLFPPVRSATGDQKRSFAILGAHGHGFGASGVEIELRAKSTDNSTKGVASVVVSFSSFDHRACHYGQILAPSQTKLLHRNHVYGSGPSVASPSPECLDLLVRYLGKPPSRILDVGCGIGAYAEPLVAGGFEWHGVEVSAGNCDRLAEQQLAHTQVDGSRLPFGNQSFDAAIAVEVLEHVPEPDALLAEIARVAPRLCLSVPNIELIPYLRRYVAVPWHMLEADHKNFFTRWSLGHLLEKHFREVEILTYGELPLRTPEGDRLDLHLFGIAWT